MNSEFQWNDKNRKIHTLHWLILVKLEILYQLAGIWFILKLKLSPIWIFVGMNTILFMKIIWLNTFNNVNWNSANDFAYFLQTLLLISNLKIALRGMHLFLSMFRVIFFTLMSLSNIALSSSRFFRESSDSFIFWFSSSLFSSSCFDSFRSLTKMCWKSFQNSFYCYLIWGESVQASLSGLWLLFSSLVWVIFTGASLSWWDIFSLFNSFFKVVISLSTCFSWSIIFIWTFRVSFILSLNVLLVSFQFVLIAFSALLIILLASLSNCCEENLKSRKELQYSLRYYMYLLTLNSLMFEHWSDCLCSMTEGLTC